MKALVEARTPAITVVGKSWDLHVREVLGVSLEENIRMIADSVGYVAPMQRPRGDLRRRALLRRLQAQPRLRPEDPPRRRESPAPRGSSSATPTAAPSPRRSPRPSTRSARPFDVPVGIHTHNDGELAVANTLAAVLAGGRRRSRGRSTGSASAAGTSTSARVIANLALKYSRPTRS